MPNAGVQTKFVAAEVVSLRDDPKFDERWLEQQIRERANVLGLGEIEILHSQLTQKEAGRLDLLAEDKENQYRYAIELMLGRLDKSHIVRTLDYWLREKAREKRDEWQTVAVVVAEDIRSSRYFHVVKFLTEKMPMQVGNRSANFVTFAPKKKFLRVSARFLEDSEKWKNRLQKAGFHIVGGTPGKSVRFRATKREIASNKTLLSQMFTEGYQARTSKNSD